MNSTRSFRRFFVNGIIVLIILIVLIEFVTWTIGYRPKLRFINQNGGFLLYLSRLIKAVLIPQIMTVFVLTFLLQWLRRRLPIEIIDINRSSLVRYQLSFLPIMLIAFVIFIPFTQSVRYLLIAFPNYSFDDYWHEYIVEAYSWKTYFRYLFPVLFIGYVTLNVSLLRSLLKDNSSPAVQ